MACGTRQAVVDPFFCLEFIAINNYERFRGTFCGLFATRCDLSGLTVLMIFDGQIKIQLVGNTKGPTKGLKSSTFDKICAEKQTVKQPEESARLADTIKILENMLFSICSTLCGDSLITDQSIRIKSICDINQLYLYPLVTTGYNESHSLSPISHRKAKQNKVFSVFC